MSRSTRAVWQESCPDCTEQARLLRNLRYLAPFAQPQRMPKWTRDRSWRLHQIAWRHRLPRAAGSCAACGACTRAGCPSPQALIDAMPG